ncbi:hypothetical protein P40081_28250 [Paenibacillus sp. FSL P4-0081]|nr:hypothetical protein P40081_28250 [Paenibacillus sp. FSL P4-0081]
MKFVENKLHFLYVIIALLSYYINIILLKKLLNMSFSILYNVIFKVIQKIYLNPRGFLLCQQSKAKLLIDIVKIF